MEKTARAVYAIFGVFALAGGLVIFAAPSVLMGPGISGLTAHLLREEASMFLFVGLMCFWCLRHFPNRRPVHLALIVFTVFFAGAHWMEVVEHPGAVWGALVNSVPPLLLLLTMPRRSRPSA
jgi:hypothetical protein